MIHRGAIFVITIFLFSYGIHARDLSSIHPVKEKINKLYKNPAQLDPAQLHSLEMKLAESLLEEIQSMSQKSFQKSINEVKKIAVQALYLYKKGHSRLKDKNEKSKFLFRIGYLYEIIDSNQNALNIYKNITSLSISAKKIQEAKTLYKRVQNRIKESKPFSVVSESDSLRNIVSQVAQDIKKKNWEKALINFEKSCQEYLFQKPCSRVDCAHSPKVIKNLIHLAHQTHYENVVTKMYSIYISYFPLDFVMVLSAAEWATQVRDFVQALDFYQRYILVQKYTIQSSYRTGVQKDLKKQNDQWVNLESVFHLYHSVAQSSRNPDLEIQAYDFYFKNSVLKKSAFKVGYLKNKVLFQLKQFNIVAPIFREIVLSSYSTQSIKEEAAMLALRSILEIDKNIVARKWSYEFSLILPHKKDEFQKLLAS